MIINKPHHCTVLEIWTPRYSDAYKEHGERVALLAQYKVDQSSPYIIIKFTKAKHLIGQRYAIRKVDAQACKIDSNGKIPCYAVPLSKLESWESGQEVIDKANNIFK